ncbi:c-type cytochrome [Azohydromonas lata]|uniref:C-type cytochrome n=1 Tax=Azohydromonas lata TaxID=45677 RepID=A0ABU5I9Z7_9BURK|nr:c-type cytochrome [Azohydromonas lata]MDZ5455929.1 c-type cytochrome [Azohydromonas lata]
MSLSTQAALLALMGVAATLAAAPARAADGTAIYNQTCAMCHNPGLANSPKFGDKAAWEPRLAQGRDTLLQHALKGKGVMPAKGGNPKLTDEEVAAALDHMLAAAK